MPSPIASPILFLFFFWLRIASPIDPYEHLPIVRNSDGSLTRSYPVAFTSQDDPQSWPVLCKDVPLNSALGTSIRIFVPKSQLEPNVETKLPVIIYFHGGGFILGSPAISLFHDFTARMAAELPAIVLSVDHRLAPEHRLPAAYDDAADALIWVRDQALFPAAAEEWLKCHADFTQCFIMGSSAGGNIAYQLALRALSLNIIPVKIAGLIMDQPFFGGEERTESEIRMACDPYVPLAVTDLMWDLALPVGADRDHPYSRPRAVEGMKKGKGLPRCLVRGYLGNPVIDRMRTVAAMLEKGGVSVVALLDEEGFHGMEMFNASKAEAMVDDLRNFLCHQTAYSFVCSNSVIVTDGIHRNVLPQQLASDARHY